MNVETSYASQRSHCRRVRILGELVSEDLEEEDRPSIRNTSSTVIGPTVSDERCGDERERFAVVALNKTCGTVHVERAPVTGANVL